MDMNVKVQKASTMCLTNLLWSKFAASALAHKHVVNPSHIMFLHSMILGV